MMERREFVKQVVWSLAAGWAAGQLSWAFPAGAEGPDLRLAVLSDAHLKDGNEGRPEARSLARAVAEINTLTPAPHLVLGAGDLSHRGRPDALDLGREILSDLPAPLWTVRGEGDGGAGGLAPWVRRFGEARFSRPYRGVHFLGLDTALGLTSRGPVFAIGREQRQALARELAALAPEAPLVILSHAPLVQIYHPWQQWTGDALDMIPLLARFRQVVCLHGHVHGAGIRGQGAGIRGGAAAGPGWGMEKWSGWSPFTPGGLEGYLYRLPKVFSSPPAPSPPAGGRGDQRKMLSAEARGAAKNYPEGEIGPGAGPNRIFHLSLPATAWPRPPAVQGTPAVPRPGIGPHGCGWAHLTFACGAWRFQPHLWES